MIQATKQQGGRPLLREIKMPKQAASNKPKNKTILPTSAGSLAIKLEEISYFKSNDMYCFLHTIYGERYFITRSLKWVKERINQKHFLRIHKCYFINSNNIYQYLKADGGQLQMECKHLLPIARSKRPLLAQWIQP